MDMDSPAFLGLFVSLFVVLGACVLASYVMFWRFYLQCSKHQRARVWACWGGSPQNLPWGLCAMVSTVAFVCFSAQIWYDHEDVNARGNVLWLMLSYAWFLVASALYAPLMMSEWHRGFVIADLALVSVSVIALCAWAWKYMRFGSAFEACIMVGMSILAFHCTCLDLFAWGWTWYHWPEEKSVPLCCSFQASPSISGFDVSRASTRSPPHPLHLRV